MIMILHIIHLIFLQVRYKKSFFIDYNLTKSYNHIHNIYEKHDLYLLQTLTIVNFGDIYNIHNVLQKNDFKSELILKVCHETFSLSDIMKNNYIIKLTYNALYFLETSIENMGQIYRYRCLVDQIQSNSLADKLSFESIKDKLQNVNNINIVYFHE